MVPVGRQRRHRVYQAQADGLGAATQGRLNARNGVAVAQHPATLQRQARQQGQAEWRVFRGKHAVRVVLPAGQLPGQGGGDFLQQYQVGGLGIEPGTQGGGIVALLQIGADQAQLQAHLAGLRGQHRRHAEPGQREQRCQQQPARPARRQQHQAAEQQGQVQPLPVAGQVQQPGQVLRVVRQQRHQPGREQPEGGGKREQAQHQPCSRLVLTTSTARARSWPQPPSTSWPALLRTLVSTPRLCR